MTCTERIAAIAAAIDDPNATASRKVWLVRDILEQPGECCVTSFVRRQLEPLPGLPDEPCLL